MNCLIKTFSFFSVLLRYRPFATPSASHLCKAAPIFQSLPGFPVIAPRKASLASQARFSIARLQPGPALHSVTLLSTAHSQGLSGIASPLQHRTAPTWSSVTLRNPSQRRSPAPPQASRTPQYSTARNAKINIFLKKKNDLFDSNGFYIQTNNVQKSRFCHTISFKKITIY